MNTYRVERIINEYNPEFDCIPDGPNVTWAENDLAEFVLSLLERIEKLEELLKLLKEKE